MTWSRTRARAWRREVAARTCGATRRLERRAAGAARTARVTAAMASWVRAAARDEMGGRRCFGRRYPRQVEGFRDSEIRSRVSMPGPGVVVVAVAGCRFTSADRASLDPTRADTMSPASVERCVGEFRATLTRGALPSSECVSFGVSKGLSLGIVAGAVLVKVPQISRIVANGSAKGLRVSMFRSEVLSGTVAIAYFARSGIALAAYAELFFILLQNLVILALIRGFGDGEKTESGKKNANENRAVSVAFAFAAHAATVALLAFGVLANVSDSALETLYNCTTAVLIAGRAPQIAANFRAKSTGELSLASQALMSAGSAARIFTTAQEGGGVSMLLAYGMSSFMNWAILAQMLLYSKGGSSGKKRGKRKTN